MVVTWAPAAHQNYYLTQTEYFLGAREPDGVWRTSTGDFGIVDGAKVDRETFVRLYAAQDVDGQSLITNGGSGRNDRVPAFDLTFSAPKSVSIVWGLSDESTRKLIEEAQLQAVRASLDFIEKYAARARRGHGGSILEPVGLTCAIFQHGTSREAEHADKRVYADVCLHHHGIVLSVARRNSDQSVGALYAVALRQAKMLAGGIYHAHLSYALERAGFSTFAVGKNGTFELDGVPRDLCETWSARRTSIVDKLSEYGATSAGAPKLAAAITKGTRTAKKDDLSTNRHDLWRQIAKDHGYHPDELIEAARTAGRENNRSHSADILRQRLNALPARLTTHELTFDRYELLRGVAEAFVASGVAPDAIEREADHLVASGAVVKLGQDGRGQVTYSTPEAIRIERELDASTRRLNADKVRPLDERDLIARCRAHGLSQEQTDAAVAATRGQRISIISGAAGSGKTRTLLPVVESYRAASHPVYGGALAWRIARQLAADLGIESRAIESWRSRIDSGKVTIARGSVFIIDEISMLSAAQMLSIGSAVEKAGGRLLLVGEKEQLQAPGAGSGLDIVSRIVDAQRVTTIVRQRDRWMREAIAAFREGRIDSGWKAFQTHDRVLEVPGPKAAVKAVVDRWEEARNADPANPIVLIARTNAVVDMISREVRARLSRDGQIRGDQVDLRAVTPSGHDRTITLAAGDEIRFLVRNDRLGIVNGTTATVMRVECPHDGIADKPENVKIYALLEGREIAFNTQELADGFGRVKLGYAYASTIAGVQGLTCDRAVVLVDPNMDNANLYVSASRARLETTLIIDSLTTDRRIIAERSGPSVPRGVEISREERTAWLTERFSRVTVKRTTLEPMFEVERSRTASNEREGRRARFGLRENSIG
jgi:conjugative relaxase-like TrwC/TraI family protein